MKLINNKIALAVFTALSISACSPDKTSEEYISAAKVNLNNSDNNAALISLKNAVRKDLKNAEARMLLGSLYLNMGDAESGEKEFKRALDLNGDVENVLPKLLKAFNLQSKNKDTLSLIEKYEVLTPEILLYQALAYNKLDQKDNARLSIARANDISTESIYSQLGQAYLKADMLDVDGALENIDKILATDPTMAEALILKGQLHFSKKEYKSAIEAFNEYHRLLPQNVQIRLFLANAYVKSEQFEQANGHLDFLLKLSPEHPFINQLKGVVYYQNADFVKALEHTKKAIQNGIDSTSSRIVAGLSAFKLERYEEAHQYLSTLSELPATHPVQRVLALVQMQLGYTTNAGITLDELEGLTGQDVNLFTSASFELLKAGKIGEARRILAKTNTIENGSSQEMTKIGILKLTMNDLEGLTNLEKAVEIDPERPMAKVALAAAYIEAKEYDKALELADKWKKSHPDKVEGYNLAAKIQLLKNDTAAAEIEFNNGLKVNKNNPHSLMYFANQALEENKAKMSIGLLERIFIDSPHHLDGLIVYYRAHKAIGKPSIAVDKLANSFSQNKNNATYRLIYSQVLFKEELFDEVINILEDVENQNSQSTTHWMLLGSSYARIEKNDKALVIYNNWIKNQPQNRLAWLSKLSFQEHLTDYNGALNTVEKALKSVPGDGPFTILKANYLILSKKFSQAQMLLGNLTNEQKELPFVKGLQGKLHLAKGNFKGAISDLEVLYESSSSSYIAALLFTAYEKVGRKKTALDFIQKHVDLHAEDTLARKLLAESAISVKPLLAKEHYLVLLKSSPNNLIFLNNLAWVEYLLANYNEAERYINKSIGLNANHPSVLDTAGLIQLKLGNKNQAIELLKKASALAPTDEKIARHYQDALAQ